MASIRQENLTEHPYHRTYAPCVERLGLGKVFRERSLRSDIPAQQAGRLSTTADSNNIRDNGMFNSGYVDRVVTGAAGARAESPNQDTHIYNFGSPASVAIYHQVEKNTTIRSEHNIVDDKTGTHRHLSSVSSHALASESELQTTTNSESSILTTIVESSGSDTTIPTIWVSGTSIEDLSQSECASERGGECAEPKSTPGEHATRINNMGARAIKTYETVCCMLPSYVRRRTDSDDKAEWILINNQKRLLELYNSRLPGAIRQFPCSPILHVFLSHACSNIVNTLNSLQKQLDQSRSFMESHPINQENGELTTADYTPKLKKWYKGLRTVFETYVKAVSVFVPHRRQSDPAGLAEILVELSAESHASSHLKRFLCLACPQQCHSSHTAYLSLEPEHSSISSALPVENVLEPRSEASYEASWHMAFKSTIAKEPKLIWLKVLSSVSLKTVSQSSPTVQLLDEDESQGNSTKATQRESNSGFGPTPSLTSKKRRASISPSEPPQKMLKQTPVQSESPERLNPERRHGIEMCPEYLTWNNKLDNSEHAIIKMTDSTVGDHRMFYLPRSKFREKVKSISLGEAIKHKLHQRSQASGTVLWVTRTARLVAEAVIRFDLRDNDGTLEESIVFHEAVPIKLDSLTSPFLEVKLEKTMSFSHGVAIDTDYQQQWKGEPRRHVLLDLGVILVQLGTRRDDVNSLGTPPTGPDARQRFIIAHARKTQIGVSDQYAGAVRSCASLFKNAEVAGEEEFLGSFLKRIVQPLRDCERKMRSQVATTTIVP